MRRAALLVAASAAACDQACTDPCRADPVPLPVGFAISFALDSEHGDVIVLSGVDVEPLVYRVRGNATTPATPLPVHEATRSPSAVAISPATGDAVVALETSGDTPDVVDQIPVELFAVRGDDVESLGALRPFGMFPTAAASEHGFAVAWTVWRDDGYAGTAVRALETDFADHSDAREVDASSGGKVAVTRDGTCVAVPHVGDVVVTLGDAEPVVLRGRLPSRVEVFDVHIVDGVCVVTVVSTSADYVPAGEPTSGDRLFRAYEIDGTAEPDPIREMEFSGEQIVLATTPDGVFSFERSTREIRFRTGASDDVVVASLQSGQRPGQFAVEGSGPRFGFVTAVDDAASSGQIVLQTACIPSE